MSVSAERLDWLLEQLDELGGVTAKRMFGGAALYRDGAIFAIAFDDALFVKASPSVRRELAAGGHRPFVPPRGRPSRTYFAVPDDVLEDSTRLAAWCRRALDGA